MRIVSKKRSVTQHGFQIRNEIVLKNISFLEIATYIIIIQK